MRKNTNVIKNKKTIKEEKKDFCLNILIENKYESNPENIFSFIIFFSNTFALNGIKILKIFLKFH
jgi:hypothetical protein